MKAMVLCAGFGTRLRPLTDRVPKPLVPLCGIPLLRYNFALLHNAGVREVVVNTHHLAAEMEKGALEVGQQVGLLVTISREVRSEEHTSELQSQSNLVCRLLLEKKKKKIHMKHVPSSSQYNNPPQKQSSQLSQATTLTRCDLAISRLATKIYNTDNGRCT